MSSTYIEASKAIKGKVGGNAGGNLYVKAFRWATDRILQNSDQFASVIAFVSPNSLSDGTSLVGMRKVLRDEFTDIYVVNLRGNAYKAGEEFKKEGDKIFGGASRNGVQITFLIRNPSKDLSAPATLHYAMVPERQSLSDKFAWLSSICDCENDEFSEIALTKEHDWIDLRNPEFDNLLEVCKPQRAIDDEYIVSDHFRGIATSLDSYVYSFSKDELRRKIIRMISYFNECAQDYRLSKYSDSRFDEIVNNANHELIKWTDTLKNSLKKKKLLVYDESKIREILYRPFTKCFLYEDWDILSSGKSASKLFDRPSSEMTGQIDMGGGGENFRRDDTATTIRAPRRETHLSISDSPEDAVESSETHEHPEDHDKQRQQYEVRGPRHQQYPGSSEYSRFSADSAFRNPAIVIASPNAQSLAAVCCTPIPCDLHFVAPGQTSRILPVEVS